MAISGTAYDPKLFQFLVAEQDDYGTINPNSSGSPDNDYIALDVDSIGSPTLGINQTLDVRSGSRVLLDSNFFQDNIASVKEISVSGTATTEGLDLLLSHFTLDTSAPYDIASNVATSSYGVGTTNQTDNQILSIIMKSAASNSDLAFKDCFLTSLTLNGDANTEGGRIKFSATFQTGTKSASGVLTASTTTADTAITANDYFMSAFDADDRIIAGVANAVVSSFSLTVDNPVDFSGIVSTGYEQATRSGEISATASFSVLYDNNFLDMFERFNTTQVAGSSTGQTLMAHQASLADGVFGFDMPRSVITNVSFNEGASMMLDIEVKAVGNGSNKFLGISC
tara:strand:+ start:1027 stop:2046 length:1020 start_codon:yes stop_codon:yes gene_type:complete